MLLSHCRVFVKRRTEIKIEMTMVIGVHRAGTQRRILLTPMETVLGSTMSPLLRLSQDSLMSLIDRKQPFVARSINIGARRRAFAQELPSSFHKL
jgi:hypothetical protein